MKLIKTTLISLLAGTAMAVSGMTASAQVIGDAPAGTYEEDPNHAYITFSYNHQGYARPYLRFRKHDTTLQLDPANPANSTVSVVVDASSIDSGVDVFDGHLKGAKHFDVANHPTITFNSTALTQSSPTTGTMVGDLNMKGQTHPISLDVTFNKLGKNRGGVDTLGFSARGSLMRSQWGLGMAVPAVSDEVELMIEIELAKTK